MKRLGADKRSNIAKIEDWWKEVIEKTGGKGVNVVYGLVDLVNRSLKCPKQKRTILLCDSPGTRAMWNGLP